jgi:hypothetical protein
MAPMISSMLDTPNKTLAAGSVIVNMSTFVALGFKRALCHPVLSFFEVRSLLIDHLGKHSPIPLGRLM